VQAANGQLIQEQGIERVVGDHRNAQREHPVQDTVVAHEGRREDQVADLLVITQPSAVSDHEHQVGPQNGEVIGNRLGVGRADADVDQRDPGLVRELVMPGRHLAALGVRAAAVRERGPERFDMPGVVGQ
jgi:hypothetical protein